MPTEIKKKIELEVVHVLFLDIVGYSKRLTNEQQTLIDQLNQVIRGSEEFQDAEAAGRLIKIPTGDGMALVFYKSPAQPVECALEISRALKTYPELRLRMGVHSGPVSAVTDLNDRTNAAGIGINVAQRVMDRGDAGHILLSKRVAEDLEQYEHWQPLLHDLGTCEVKHDVRVGIVNLFSDGVGNPHIPKKIQLCKKQNARGRWILLATALLLLAGIITTFTIVSRRPVRSNYPIEKKSIAVLPFENLSEEKANAFFADGVQDEILTNLAKISDLKVISRTSVMQYKSGVARNLRQIAEDLGVGHILEGSVQRAANRVHVNAQLIDARTDTHVWAQTYDRTLDDIFKVEGEIASNI